MSSTCYSGPMQQVRKAVIAAAGLGTRFLPQTKAMPKEMLPVLDRPIIQWIVEELVDVGVTDIIIVTGPTKRAIEDHFDRSVELEQALLSKNKDKQANELKRIAEMANFIYIRQKGEIVGTALPVMNAAHLIDDEPFFYLSADDMVYGEKTRAAQLLEAYQQTGKSAVALFEIDKKDSASYGMAQLGTRLADGLFDLDGYIEKPAPEVAPSNYMIIMSHLFTPDILKYFDKIQPTHGGELYAADAVNMQCQAGGVVGTVINGEYLDCGNHINYLRAQLYFASKYGVLTDEVLRGIELPSR